MRLIFLLIFALSSTAHATDSTLVIPGQGWQLTFDAPPLTKMGEKNRGGQYVYEANSGKFNLSLFVEDPSCSGGKSHEDFYKCFWPKSSRNPMIVQATVTATEMPDYYKVAYVIEAPLDGRTIKQMNVNFLISYRGKWTDLHISVVEPTAADLAILDVFEKSLKYAETGVAETAKRDKPQVKFSYLNSDIPITDRLDRLDGQCAPLVAKRSQSIVDFYAKLLAEARDTEQSIEAREAQMPKLWGYCIGVGLKM